MIDDGIAGAARDVEAIAAGAVTSMADAEVSHHDITAADEHASASEADAVAGSRLPGDGNIRRHVEIRIRIHRDVSADCKDDGAA